MTARRYYPMPGDGFCVDAFSFFLEETRHSTRSDIVDLKMDRGRGGVANDVLFCMLVDQKYEYILD